jgi:hypothetical protein
LIICGGSIMDAAILTAASSAPCQKGIRKGRPVPLAHQTTGTITWWAPALAQ